MKKMTIRSLKTFCKRHGITYVIQENGYPDLICSETFGMIPKYSDAGFFWDFVPYGNINELDQFIEAYTELNGEWF